jgi:hypothetical protein
VRGLYVKEIDAFVSNYTYSNVTTQMPIIQLGGVSFLCQAPGWRKRNGVRYQVIQPKNNR